MAKNIGIFSPAYLGLDAKNLKVTTTYDSVIVDVRRFKNFQVLVTITTVWATTAGTAILDVTPVDKNGNALDGRQSLLAAMVTTATGKVMAGIAGNGGNTGVSDTLTG